MGVGVPQGKETPWETKGLRAGSPRGGSKLQTPQAQMDGPEAAGGGYPVQGWLAKGTRLEPQGRGTPARGPSGQAGRRGPLRAGLPRGNGRHRQGPRLPRGPGARPAPPWLPPARARVHLREAAVLPPADSSGCPGGSLEPAGKQTGGSERVRGLGERSGVRGELSESTDGAERVTQEWPCPRGLRGPFIWASGIQPLAPPCRPQRTEAAEPQRPGAPCGGARAFRQNPPGSSFPGTPRLLWGPDGSPQLGRPARGAAGAPGPGWAPSAPGVAGRGPEAEGWLQSGPWARKSPGLPRGDGGGPGQAAERPPAALSASASPGPPPLPPPSRAPGRAPHA